MRRTFGRQYHLAVDSPLSCVFDCFVLITECTSTEHQYPWHVVYILFRNPRYEASSPVGEGFSLIRQDFTLVSVRRESTQHCTCIKTRSALGTCGAAEHNHKHDSDTSAPTQAHTHTSVVLSPLLVLTAHQSPVAACLNMLTSAISLKSLSIRSSCAVPPTRCKPRVRNPPTCIHARLELTHSHILCTQMGTRTLCSHTHAHTHLA